jgi:hypothetical protein
LWTSKELILFTFETCHLTRINRLCNVGLGRPTSIKEQDITTPRPHRTTDIEFCTWSPSRLEAYDELQAAARIGSTSHAACELFCVVSPTLETMQVAPCSIDRQRRHTLTARQIRPEQRPKQTRKGQPGSQDRCSALDLLQCSTNLSPTAQLISKTVAATCLYVTVSAWTLAFDIHADSVSQSPIPRVCHSSSPSVHILAYPWRVLDGYCSRSLGPMPSIGCCYSRHIQSVPHALHPCKYSLRTATPTDTVVLTARRDASRFPQYIASSPLR